MIRWPLPYEGSPNGFEVVGRYIGQVVTMERFVDMILLQHGAKPRALKRAKLNRKIDDLRVLLHRPELELDEWEDLPDKLTKVSRNRNRFAHRMFERGAMPSHYGQGIPYVPLSDEELRAEIAEAVEITDLCRRLLMLHVEAPLNPSLRYSRDGVSSANPPSSAADPPA